MVGSLSRSRFAAMAISAGLLLPARHLGRVARASATANASKRDASRAAREIDDLPALASQPNGRVVSLVGRVRGHGYLMHRANGHKAVGLALPCWHQTLVETLHNFDLVDEFNRSVLVVASGARLLGKPNVYLARTEPEDRAFVHALNLRVRQPDDLESARAPRRRSGHGHRREDHNIVATIEAKHRDLQLSVDSGAYEMAVMGDHQILASVLANLVQNAVKFTRPHGHVTIRARATADRALIDVQDECGGLPPGKKEDLFRPFEQRGADQTGMGLGLSISLKGVRASGGEIHLRDLPGSGCLFTVDLPLAPPAT